MTNKEIFDLVSDIGVEMLKNGGEIPRAVMTMEQIGKRYGIKDYDVYIIANGIFATGTMGEESYYSKIRNVPISGTCLCKVEAINDLSRKVAEGKTTPEEAKERLENIKKWQEYPPLITTLSMGIGSGGFCYLFKGTLLDCAVVVLAATLLGFFMMYMDKKFTLTKIIKNIILSMFVACVCCIFKLIGLGDNLGSMVIASMMPLVPGIPFTNAVRDFLHDDYLSGVIRLADAAIVGISTGCGVGITVIAFNMLTNGGIML